MSRNPNIDVDMTISVETWAMAWAGYMENVYPTVPDKTPRLAQCTTCDVYWSKRFSDKCWVCEQDDAIIATVIRDKFEELDA